MSERLAAYLRERMPAVRNLSVTGLQRKSGGASGETWAFTAQWIENDVRHALAEPADEMDQAHAADIRGAIRAFLTAQIARDEEWVSVFPGTWG